MFMEQSMQVKACQHCKNEFSTKDFNKYCSHTCKDQAKTKAYHEKWAASKSKNYRVKSNQRTVFKFPVD